MKFIHFADAHLDSPFRGLSFLPSTVFDQIYRASDESLKRIVDLALKEQVDLVLIAGDTFDSDHPIPRSQLFFSQQIKRLTDQEIQVVMIFGNHDHMAASNLLVAPNKYFKLLGDGQKIEQITFTTRNNFNYDVVGFSYLNNHIVDDLVKDFPKKGPNYTFGLMHAQEKESRTEKNVYAPYKLDEIVDLNYDYFALGHIHARRVLSQKPWIVYSGNIQGRHINELGVKGCYLGTIDESTKETKLQFYQTGPIVWKQGVLPLTKAINKSELREQVLQALAQVKETTYFSLKLTGAQFLTDEEIELVEDNTFWQSISQALPYMSQLVGVRLETEDLINLNQASQQYFDQAEAEIFASDQLAKIIKAWSHKAPITENLAQNPQFLDEVMALTKVKLANKLKGIEDETEKN